MTSDSLPSIPSPRRKSTTFTRLGAALAGAMQRAAQRKALAEIDVAEPKDADTTTEDAARELQKRLW